MGEALVFRFNVDYADRVTFNQKEQKFVYVDPNMVQRAGANGERLTIGVDDIRLALIRETDHLKKEHNLTLRGPDVSIALAAQLPTSRNPARTNRRLSFRSRRLIARDRRIRRLRRTLY